MSAVETKKTKKRKAPIELSDLGIENLAQKNKLFKVEPETDPLTLPSTSTSTVSENKLRLPYQPFTCQKARPFKKILLSATTDVRIGVINNKVVLRISCVSDLEEKRPAPPESFMNGDFTGIVNYDGYNKRILSETVFLQSNEVVTLKSNLDTVIRHVEQGSSLSINLSGTDCAVTNKTSAKIKIRKGD